MKTENKTEPRTETLIGKVFSIFRTEPKVMEDEIIKAMMSDNPVGELRYLAEIKKNEVEIIQLNWFCIGFFLALVIIIVLNLK